MTASNRNLFELSKKRKFRPDLYHRLSTFVIEIPPLRERKDDILPLLEYYIYYYAEQMGKEIKEISPILIERLTDYDFPGNVRELRNMVERAIILCDNETIGWDNFSFNLPITDNMQEDILLPSGTLDLAIIEERVIRKALERSNNNKSKAAELLNITWQALDRRLEKYGLK